MSLRPIANIYYPHNSKLNFKVNEICSTLALGGVQLNCLNVNII